MAMDHAPAVDPWAAHPAPYIARIAYAEGWRALDDWLHGKGIRMNDNDQVSRTFAGMLGELEDVATQLAERQSALARELADVSAELERVEIVRAAMTGKTAKRSGQRRPYGSGGGSGYKQSRENLARVEKIREWAKDRGEFRGGDVADVIDVSPQRVGPILAGMVRRGELTATGEGRERRYTLA